MFKLLFNNHVQEINEFIEIIEILTPLIKFFKSYIEEKKIFYLFYLLLLCVAASLGSGADGTGLGGGCGYVCGDGCIAGWLRTEIEGKGGVSASGEDVLWRLCGGR